jgi:predicted transcriptional regulator
MLSNITIKKLEKPIDPDLDKDIDWICKSLGFVSSRDFEETASKIFNVIIKARSKNMELTSEQISKQINVTRGAIMHHLKLYIDSGLITQKKTKYVLRTRSIEKTIDEIELDILRVLDNIKKMAKEIDEKLGLKER